MTLADGFDAIPKAAEVLGRGGMVVVVDSPDRENEGDLVLAAEHATPETINFMATHGRGLICAPLLADRLAALGIPPMAHGPGDAHGTAFHVGVDVRAGTSTGISAADRAATLRALIDPSARPEDFLQPGHVFPLAYREGGVLRRAGHTEASIDLVRLGGCAPGAVICEIASADGEMARLPELRRFAAQHELPIVTITDLIAYRRRHESQVHRVSESRMPLDEGDFRAIAYHDVITGEDHLALVLGDIAGVDGVLVRVHSECLTGDVFGSRRCDCGAQLQLALRRIGDERRGVLVYLKGHEGRGIGLANKIHAYRLQDAGLDTVEANLELGLPADRREYGAGMRILEDLGVSRMRLLTNNPVKRQGLEGFGLSVVEQVPLRTTITSDNRDYLATKAAKMGHLLPRAV